MVVLEEENRLIWTTVGNWRSKGIHWGEWYRPHVYEVKRLVLKERLLLYNLREGWGRCART